MSRAEEKALGRGFLAGIFWGAIVGVTLLLVSNVTLDRQQLSFPRPEAVPVEVPAGSEFDQARPESDPVVPEVETRPSSDAVRGVTPPPDVVEQPPTFDTSALEVPEPTIDGPGGLGAIPEIADDAQIDVTGPGDTTRAQPLDNQELTKPDTPAAAPETSTEGPAPVQAPEANAGEGPLDEVTALVPERDEVSPVLAPSEPDAAAAPDGLVAPSDDTETALAPSTSEAPEVMTSPEVLESPTGEDFGAKGIEGQSFFKPVEEIGDLAPEIETDRLPRIEDNSQESTGAAPEVAIVAPSEPSETGPDSQLPTIRRGIDASEQDTAEGAESPTAVSGPAIEAWKQAFSPTSADPLFSLVLVHQGEGNPDAQVLEQLPKTVAFAVNAGLSNAAGITAAYREDGREVVMIPSLPIGATPQDVEVALRVNFETVTEAVAVMDSDGDGFQSDRDAVAQLVDVVIASGHGMITFPRGLNTAHQRAQRAGVPAGLIFRDIDGDGQTTEQILRGMDRAAFRARADRPVILVGRAVPGTFDAVDEWTGGTRAQSIQLAPVSAVLLSE